MSEGQAAAPRTVLMIAGAGRSGSTLLELMLDQVPGVVAIGELTELWDAALGRGERCGCGMPFAECPFWREVGEEAFGGWEHVDSARWRAIHHEVARNRRFPRLLASPILPSFRTRLDEYARIVSRVLEAVAAVSDASVIVDASKWPSHAMVLRRAGGVDLRIAHLVRDPRGVAYSWARELERPQAHGSRSVVDKAEMRRDRPSRSASHWTAINLGIEIVAALGVPRRFVRYEDLIASPRRTLTEVLEFAGRPARREELGFVGDGAVELAPGHGIAGNPSRFRHGPVDLRSSEEWRTRLPRRARLQVEAITFPVAALYRRRASGRRP